MSTLDGTMRLLGLKMPRFSAVLLNHASDPRNGGPLEQPDAVGRASLEGRAPLVALFLGWDGRHIVRAGFQTNGCGVAIAACSALTELIVNRTSDECLSLGEGDIVQALDGIPPDKEFCADLAITALRDALRKLPQSVAGPANP